MMNFASNLGRKAFKAHNGYAILAAGGHARPLVQKMDFLPLVRFSTDYISPNA